MEGNFRGGRETFDSQRLAKRTMRQMSARVHGTLLRREYSTQFTRIHILVQFVPIVARSVRQCPRRVHFFLTALEKGLERLTPSRGSVFPGNQTDLCAVFSLRGISTNGSLHLFFSFQFYIKLAQSVRGWPAAYSTFALPASGVCATNGARKAVTTFQLRAAGSVHMYLPGRICTPTDASRTVHGRNEQEDDDQRTTPSSPKSSHGGS